MTYKASVRYNVMSSAGYKFDPYVIQPTTAVTNSNNTTTGDDVLCGLRSAANEADKPVGLDR